MKAATVACLVALLVIVAVVDANKAHSAAQIQKRGMEIARQMHTRAMQAANMHKRSMDFARQVSKNMKRQDFGDDDTYGSDLSEEDLQNLIDQINEAYSE